MFSFGGRFFGGSGLCGFFGCRFLLGGGFGSSFGTGFFCRFLCGFGSGFCACFFGRGLACSGFCLAAFLFFGAALGFDRFAFGVKALLFCRLFAVFDAVDGVFQGGGIDDLGIDGGAYLFAFFARRFFAADVHRVFAAQEDDERQGEEADADAGRATEVVLDAVALRRVVFVHCVVSAALSGGCSVTRPTFGAPACCRKTMPSMTLL